MREDVIGHGAYIKGGKKMGKRKPVLIEEVEEEVIERIEDFNEEVEKTKPDTSPNYRYGDAEHDPVLHSKLKPKGVPHNKRWPYPGD